MPQTHHPPRWSVHQALARALRRRPAGGWVQPVIPLPESMRRTTEAVALMAQVHEALDRPDEQVVFGGVIFLNAATVGELPTTDQASVHSAPLPPLDFLRWPLSALARLTAGAVRKLAAVFTRRQECFNLIVLEAMRHFEARLEAQYLECRRLRQRVAELEARAGGEGGGA